MESAELGIYERIEINLFVKFRRTRPLWRPRVRRTVFNWTLRK
jgi:hypothetical protein